MQQKGGTCFQKTSCGKKKSPLSLLAAAAAAGNETQSDHQTFVVLTPAASVYNCVAAVIGTNGARSCTFCVDLSVVC